MPNLNRTAPWRERIYVDSRPDFYRCHIPLDAKPERHRQRDVVPPIGHGIVEDTKSNGIGGSRLQNFVICLSRVQFTSELYDPVSIDIPAECLDVGSAAIRFPQQVLGQKVSDIEFSVRVKRHRVLFLD